MAPTIIVYQYEYNIKGYANPVRKAMVVEPRHWCYSNAAAYEGELSVPFEVDIAEW